MGPVVGVPEGLLCLGGPEPEYSAAAGWSRYLVNALSTAPFIQNWFQVNENLKIYFADISQWL
jgi:hypothetical protein